MTDKALLWAGKISVAGVAAAVTAVLGKWDTLTIVLACMMAADYVSGLIASGIQGKLDSKVGFKGALRKVLIAVAVCVAALADYATGISGNPIRSAACLYYIGNEGISIVENLANAGVPIPKSLARFFARLKKEGDEEPKEDPQEGQAKGKDEDPGDENHE